MDATPADRLRAVLTRLDITQAEAARRLGIKQPSLAQILSGKRDPTLDWLHAAASTLGVNPRDLDSRLEDLPEMTGK